jgi:hypothetical protein
MQVIHSRPLLLSALAASRGTAATCRLSFPSPRSLEDDTFQLYLKHPFPSQTSMNGQHEMLLLRTAHRADGCPACEDAWQNTTPHLVRLLPRCYSSSLTLAQRTRITFKQSVKSIPGNPSSPLANHLISLFCEGAYTHYSGSDLLLTPALCPSFVSTTPHHRA